jgi:Protein of unknown function (DUF3176)
MQPKLLLDPFLNAKLHQSTLQKRKVLFEAWSGEFFSLILAMTFFISIIILLREYDKHLIPSWKFHLSLNSLVAILATLLRSSLTTILEEGHYLIYKLILLFY